MYECEIDFDALTVEKLIDFVFTEMVYRKVQQLEEEAAQAKQDEDYGRPWTRFRKRIEALDDEKRWIYYAERALDLLDHDVMWKGVVEACKILKYPEPSAIHRDHFEAQREPSQKPISYQHCPKYISSRNGNKKHQP